MMRPQVAVCQHVVNAVEVEKHIIKEKINQETKRIEISPMQFTDKVVHIPVVARREVSQLQYLDQVVDVLVVLVVPVSQVRVVKKTVEDPQFEIVEKTVQNPETQISDVVIDASLTCNAKCMVACETCVKNNMFMVEITVAGKMDDCDELVPELLNFVKGVVNSEDFAVKIPRDSAAELRFFVSSRKLL